MPAETPRPAPRATYRLQLNAGFDFEAAAAVAPYLSRLGVSHVYASPYLQAAAGSSHGYDVVDHHSVNQELGGSSGHRHLCQALRDHGLGQILDVVPNHMSIVDPRNRWWWDVLENGPASRYAAYFDVDWDPPESKLRNTVLLPILGDHYGRVLESGALRVERRGGGFTLHHHDHILPLAPGSLDQLMERAALRCGNEELGFLAAAASRLPLPTMTDRESRWRRHRDKEVIRERLGALSEQELAVAEAIDAEVAAVNADPDALDELLERQNYRLAHWRVAGEELDYRRFFDITSLAALRVEDEQVFADTHELVLEWLRDGTLDGLRIDHVDGLRDPAAYLERLRDATGGTWVVVEKILAADERLPGWPVAGTTGYDFLARAGGLFVDPAGEAPLTELHAVFTGCAAGFDEVLSERKRLVTRELLASDINRLAEVLVRICEGTRDYRDYARRELREALREALCQLDVYRTYVQPEAGVVGAEDATRIEAAIGRAKEARGDLDGELFDFLADILLLRRRGPWESELVMLFQQTSGPVMAKSAEDSAFYAYGRLVSLNDVGGDPGRFGETVAEFHRACRETLETHPLTLLAGSTHDTKRSEDVRARISLLSEIPERWAAAVERWARLNGRHRGNRPPGPEMEYLLYQTLVGAHPVSRERAVAYMEKAAKEARIRTSWTSPDPEYDEALRHFVAEVAADPEFGADLARFTDPLVEPGRVNSLALKLLTLTAPGVPDLYQGSELWDLSLVDPDNRRAVDFRLRERLLGEVETLSPEEIWARADEGLPKLLVVRHALELRSARPDLFGPGSGYEPIAARGEMADHVVAFARGGEALTVVPRLVLGLAGRWGEAEVRVPRGRWQNVITGESAEEGWTPLGEVCGRFPVALLARDGA
ncbi:MAG: malto-oligosyltrehalose synthase [Candidatus Dormibacteraceae bacterium]